MNVLVLPLPPLALEFSPSDGRLSIAKGLMLDIWERSLKSLFAIALASLWVSRSSLAVQGLHFSSDLKRLRGSET